MKRLTALMTRFLVIVSGYLVASVVAGIVVTTGLLFPGMMRAGADAATFIRFGIMLFNVIIVTVIVTTTVAPALRFIASAEAYQWRSVLLYVAFAGTLALLFWFLGSLVFASSFFLGRARTLVALAAGIAAGFVYWVLAGRMAGQCCEPH